jgi:mannose-6-phosphate isomerase-like protein (cupin superfamily)
LSVLAPARPTPRPLDLAELASLVRTLAGQEHLWVPRVRFGTAERRWWTRLHASATVDVWLLTWLPGHTTDLHDHGDSAAAYAVLRGRLEDVRAGAGGHLTSTLLRPGETTWIAPGVVHDVRSTGDEPAVSLHAYSRPLQRMTYYDIRDGQLIAQRTVDSHEPEQSL